MIHWLLDTNAGVGVLTIAAVVVAALAVWAAFWGVALTLLVAARVVLRRLRGPGG